MGIMNNHEIQCIIHDQCRAPLPPAAMASLPWAASARAHRRKADSRLHINQSMSPAHVRSCSRMQ